MRNHRAHGSTRVGAAAVEALEQRLLFFGSANHLEITATALTFFNSSVLSTVNAQHAVQDKSGNNGDIAPYHFDGCYFNEGATTINSRYQTILNNANPSSFNSNTMAVEFGKMLHAAEDFYAHSNWVEDGFTTIAQPGLGMWNTWAPYTIQDGAFFIEGETLAPNVSPYGTAHFSRNGHVVTVSFTGGPTFKGVISGTWVQEKDPDNIEVTHDYLNKDYDTKPGFAQARSLAIEQVKHEFSRLGALIKDRYGDAGVTKLLSTWVKPDAASQAAAAALLNITPPPPPPPTNNVTFIDKGATWKYLDNGSNQSTAWDSLGFDDSSWKSGKVQLGYGDGDEATVVGFGGNANSKFITTYFRKSFNVADPSAVQSLSLDILRDDGAVVYLNGNEVFRTNMPTGTISSSTTASAAIDDETFYSTSISPSLLQSGNNVIAVEIHQAGPTSSDISFDFDLNATIAAATTKPSAPSALAASAVSSSRIDLTWKDNSSDESKFILERSPDGVNGWTQIATPGANATSYSDISGLAPLTQYFYRIRATNSVGDSDNSANADATTLAAPAKPADPDTLVATAKATNRIDLTWLDHSDNESGFKIERSPDGVNGWTLLTTTAANATSYSNTSGLSAGVKYYYRVRATNAAGDSGDSNIANATTFSSAPGTFIAMGATWKYLDNGSNQGTVWRGNGFDDSSWKSGAAQLGYGDGDEKTVVGFGGNSSSKFITTYFRNAFNVDDPSAVSALSLKILRDDGAVVYLNGTEVYRTNMPTGTIAYTTLASSQIEDTTIYSATINPALLVAGNNVIAVEIHQGDKTSSDISFDFSLSGTVTSPASTLMATPNAGLTSAPPSTTTTTTKVISLVNDPTKPLI